MWFYYMVSHGKLVIEKKLLQRQGILGFDVWHEHDKTINITKFKCLFIPYECPRGSTFVITATSAITKDRYSGGVDPEPTGKSK
jgi:hypothetical protein